MMAKKYFQKALSVGLSLTLCASLVAPALAASFNELNDAIKGEGYDATKFNVTQDETGRTVQLLEEVKWEDGNEGSIHVDGKTVTIDLNGKNIVANGSSSSSAVWVRNEGNFTLKDTSGGPDGKITNAGKSAVFVGKDSTFTMEGGEISGNSSENASIGGGVTVINGGQFEMKGGVIQGNTSEQQTADVVVDGTGTLGTRDTTMEMAGGALLGEVNVKGDAKVSISGGVVSDDVDEGLLAENRGLLAREDGDYDVVEHPQHRWGAWETVAEPQIGIAGVQERHCQVKGCTEIDRGEIPALVPTPAPVVIDEPAVPLAPGPVTRAEFIDYLWRHEDEPESDGVCTFTDVAEDHDFILALGWAEQNGVAEAGEDGAFEPDELVTVAAVREFLGNFARVFGMDTDVYALATLAGEDGEAVLNCDEVLAEFFGEE